MTENARVRAAVAALRTGDAAALGALFAASHASMRDDYETSTADVDTLIEIAAAHPDVYGAVTDALAKDLGLRTPSHRCRLGPRPLRGRLSPEAPVRGIVFAS